MRRAVGRTASTVAAIAAAIIGTAIQAEPPAGGNAPPAPNAIVQQPRPFGYVVGDMLTQSVLLQVEGRGFEPAALPARRACRGVAGAACTQNRIGVPTGVAGWSWTIR